MKGFCLFTFLLIIVGCVPSDAPMNRQVSYFDLKSLVENQIAFLSAGEFELLKSAELNHETEIESLKLDSLGWGDELKLFIGADINSPNLIGMYEPVVGPGEINSNLNEINYLPSQKIEVGVQYLKIFYFENLDDPRKVELKIRDSNPLFQSESILKLELRRDGENNLVLNSYEITGGQKMVMMDSISYHIVGEVVKL